MSMYSNFYSLFAVDMDCIKLNLELELVTCPYKRPAVQIINQNKLS